MKRIIKKHALATRWFHWMNFLVLGIMLWSGLLIYWSNDVYFIGWGDFVIFKLFPQSFYDALGIPFHLADGMALHFVFMWLFTINGIGYVSYTFISGEWKHLLPNKKSLKEALQVTLNDFHLNDYRPPQSKYNAAQKIAYTMIILMGFGSLITGLAIYKPIQFSWLTKLIGGYQLARAEHFTLAFGYVMFFMIHMVQVVKTGWKNFRGMVTGYDIEK
ncbi:cytochrome b/b6 domain-containing protein [Flavobacterium sp. W1B]|uniref:cytochrome b/b6 domain-containing protein n=1 Tax=Flavobacterium sp. W1B TaxID=3394146 RepID=UPI0039BC6012